MVDPTIHRLGDRYEVRSLIGYGGMAKVHLAFDTRLNRIVAVKMLRIDLARDSIFQTRFRREAQAAASLNHPNIVAVYDTGEETIMGADGQSVAVPYIVMEYVEGRTVKELLANGDPLPINEAVEIVSGVLSALEYAHAASLVHRDIKPGNIMLTNTLKVKVMDFGIARALTDSQATMTQTNAVIGTAQYLSPEQARGEPVDGRSDLYSTGVVLFELLTGQPPFKGDSAVSVAYQHVQATPPAPSSITPDVPEALDRVTIKAMAKNQDDRYATAALMKTDLLSAAQGAAVMAPPVNAVAGTATMQLPPPPPSTSISHTSGPNFHSLPKRSDNTVKTDDANKRHSDKKGIGLVVLLLLALALIGAIAYVVLTQQSTKNSTVTVPDLVGYSQAEAKKTVDELGLEWVLGEPVASDKIKEGNVAKTDPDAGKVLKKGSPVIAHLSSGLPIVKIPENLTGLDPAEAQKLVIAAGLKWQLSSEKKASSEVPEGKIVSVTPNEGSQVRKGDTVTGYSSSGPDSYVVPNIQQMTLEQAIKTLKSNHINVVINNVSTDWTDGIVANTAPIEKDRIIYTEPAIGEPIKKDQTLILHQASGNSVIPDLSGMSPSDAAKKLQALRFNVQQTDEYSDSVPENKIISVEPAKSTSLPYQSTVTIKVSKGPKKTEILRPGRRPDDSRTTDDDSRGNSTVIYPDLP